MRAYEVRLSHQAKKFIKNQKSRRKYQIYNALNSLEIDPFKVPYKKLNNLEGRYRIRVGNLRIVYKIVKEKNEIWITKIGNRENVYD